MELFILLVLGVSLFYLARLNQKRLIARQLLKQQADYAAILENKFTYYRDLDPSRKAEFVARVAAFLREKKFASRGNLTLTNEMKTSIAACAVQLTFGLSPTYLSYFRMIILYPDRYYSTINKNYHLGEVNAGGAIVLSWRHFEQGYSDPHDSLNLGLHEMAHALLLENRRYGDSLLQPAHMRTFFEEARHEYRRIQRGESSVLRKYAATNAAELFSVAVETFFENPGKMHTQAPKLYSAMVRLLGQDPRKKWINTLA